MKLYGLIGYPLGHSFSKKYFEEKFAKEDINDASFELFPLKDISDLKELVCSLKGLAGLAVTIPYKEAVIPFLWAIDPIAKTIGAVNCISFAGNEMKGYNTDVKGFERSFLPLLKPHHSKALVLGTGGSAKAVQYVLTKNNISSLSVSRAGGGPGLINYEDIDEDLIWEYPVVINCTPVGMSPQEEEQPPIPYHLLTKDHFLYDLIYSPAKTKFLLQGEKKGCIVKNGLEMLELQAEENWKIWNGDSE